MAKFNFGKTLPRISGGFAVLLFCGLFCGASASLAGTQVVAWGDDTYGQTNVPPGLTNVVAIASGDGVVNMALKSNRTVVAWGENNDGQTNVPSDLSNVIAIACSGWVCLALKSDGTVEGWGADWNGQADGTGLSNVVAISAAEGESFALLRDGTVMQWGGTWRVSLSGDTNNIRAIAADGNSDEDVVHILHSDGIVATYGSFFPNSAPVPADLSNVVAITTSDNRALALRSDGTVEEWGFYTNAMPEGLSNVVAIADETALKSDGTIVQWSGNTPPPGLSNVIAITPTLALIGNASPVTHAVMNNLTKSSNAFGLTAPTQNNRVFELEYENSLTDSNWTSLLPLVAGTGANEILSDTNAFGSRRFYRVLRW